MTTIRLFASARHAVGRGEFTLAGLGLAAPTTVGSVVRALTDHSPAAKAVLEGCSVLVDGERRGSEGMVGDGAQTIDLLPPFAGG